MTAALFFINYPSIHPFLFIFFELGCPYPPYVPRADYLEDLKVFLDDIYEVCHLDISYFKQQICEPDCSDSLQCRLVCHLKKKKNPALWNENNNNRGLHKPLSSTWNSKWEFLKNILTKLSNYSLLMWTWHLNVVFKQPFFMCNVFAV